MSDDEQKPAAEETKEAPDTESKRLPPAELFAKCVDATEASLAWIVH